VCVEGRPVQWKALTVEEDMKQMSKKFLDMGAQVYVDADKVKESNKAL
jgi:phosphomethylpyrimidine synthase